MRGWLDTHSASRFPVPGPAGANSPSCYTENEPSDRLATASEAPPWREREVVGGTGGALCLRASRMVTYRSGLGAARSRNHRRVRRRRIVNIYDDNRLTRWGQRRLHSAFEEIGGDRTWTVPTIAREIAPVVTPYDWDRGRCTIEAAIQAGDEPLRHRVQLWWHEQWTDPDGQYAVRLLEPDEQAIAEEMVIAMEQTMRPQGFLNVAKDGGLRHRTSQQLRL